MGRIVEQVAEDAFEPDSIDEGAASSAPVDLDRQIAVAVALRDAVAELDEVDRFRIEVLWAGLEARQLEMGHARALLAINNPVQQLDAARQVVKKGLSVRETERLVKQMLDTAGTKKAAKSASSANADIRRLEVEVSEKLGAKVHLNHTQKGSGKLVISYNNLDELDGILKHIK